MKFIPTIFLVFAFKLFTAQTYFQQQVNYKIAVTLNDKTHTLTGNVAMQYTNNSPNKLDFLIFHIWPNGYKHKNTSLFKQLKKDASRSTKLNNFKGYGNISGLNFAIDGKNVAYTNYNGLDDVIKIMLPKALQPGASIKITTPFVVKLPDYFSRMGHNGNYYMITQWYPKPAVYDASGWHPMPYLDMGEFYSEFGNFEVTITLPSKYVVAGTGNLNTEAEYKNYKAVGEANVQLYKTVLDKKLKTDEAIAKEIAQLKVNKLNLPKTGTKTLQFKQDNVHDFAWFASPDFTVNYETFNVTSGKAVEAFTFYFPDHADQWYNSSSFCKDAVNFYSSKLGEYEYNTVKAVEGPKNQSSGGMEYPTVTLITSPDATQEQLDGVITHEVGHNFFYSILATNERDLPFFDEGFNSFYQSLYEADKYKSNSFAGPLPAEFKRLTPTQVLERIVDFFDGQIPGKVPMLTKSEDFPNGDEYAMVAYIKVIGWMFYMQQRVGEDKFDKAMQLYYSTWKNKHPQLDDFKKIMKDNLPADAEVDEWFAMLNKSGKLF
jgi:hypothetical protein